MEISLFCVEFEGIIVHCEFRGDDNKREIYSPSRIMCDGMKLCAAVDRTFCVFWKAGDVAELFEYGWMKNLVLSNIIISKKTSIH